MDRVAEYQAAIEAIINEYAQLPPPRGEVETQTIFDRERHHYQLMRVGWRGSQRIKGCAMHIDIKNGKIWIQHDGTEEGIADRFVSWGIPADDIVLAYHPPYKRPYTGFGVE